MRTRACYVPEKDLDAVYDRCDVFALTTFDEPFAKNPRRRPRRVTRSGRSVTH
jgi:hypothetical protein